MTLKPRSENKTKPMSKANKKCKEAYIDERQDDAHPLHRFWIEELDVSQIIDECTVALQPFLKF